MKAYAQQKNQPQRQSSPNIRRVSPRRLAADQAVHPITRLQRTIGNRAVHRMLQANAERLKEGSNPSPTNRSANDFSRRPAHSEAPVALQAKLTVNTPGDKHEQEADRVANQVTSMSQTQLQRTCACDGACPKCQNKQGTHEHLQTKPVEANHPRSISAPPIVNEVLRSSGQPLDRTTQGFMESRMGKDFSRIRIHADSRSAESAAAVKAHAYTVGQDIVFGANQYAPGSGQGRTLLAHELTHTLQQSKAGMTPALLQRQHVPGKTVTVKRNEFLEVKDQPAALKSKLYGKNEFVYTVKSGDSLTELALKFLGAGSKAKEIYEENRDVIGDNPELLKVGTKLIIHTPMLVSSAKAAIYQALDPKGGLMTVTGEALEYVRDHNATREVRANFEKHLKIRVSEYLKSNSPVSSFADVYLQDTVSTYGGNIKKPEDWLSTGTWLIGHCYPEVRYTVHWKGDAYTGWTANWAGVWVINDNLDLAGGTDKSPTYNKASVPLQWFFNDLLGGRRNAPIQAKWKDGGTVKIPGTAKFEIPTPTQTLGMDKTIVATPGSVVGTQHEVEHKPWVIGGAWKIGGALGAWELKDARAFYKSPASNYPEKQINLIRTKLGLPKGGIDDKFLQAVALYQRNAGLKADGKAGSETLTKMFGKDKPAVKSSAESQSDSPQSGD